jgi:shikimate kinase
VIVLVGFMGAGKTTVGRLLARRLALPFIDSDQVIEQRAGRTVQQIFADDGEPAFRDLEHVAIVDLLDGPDAVLALGGGAVMRADTREALRKHTVVLLHVDLATALDRCGTGDDRPLLKSDAVAGQLLESRLPLYESAADVVVPTVGRTPDEIADEVLRRVDHGQSEGAGAPSPSTCP